MDAYLYDGLRSPVARCAGALSSVRPGGMLAECIGALVARSPFDPARLEDVIAGCTSGAGEDALNVARHAALLAGLPIGVAGQTVNTSVRYQL